MLSPNTHRYTMFPPRCSSPPCRNIDENIAAHVGIGEARFTSTVPSGPRKRPEASVSSPVGSTGITPNRYTNETSSISPLTNWKTPVTRFSPSNPHIR